MDRNIVYKVFLPWLLLNALLVFFFIDTWIANDNTTSRALPVISYFESGTLSIDKYHHLTDDKCFINGHYYSEKAPLATFITLPVYGLLLKTGIITHSASLYGKPVYLLGSFLCGSLPFLLILLLTFNKIYKPGNFQTIVLSMLPFFGSFVFVYSGTFFGHVLTACLLLVSYIYFRQSKYFLAGLFGGLCFTSEYTIAFLLAGWCIQLLMDKGIKPTSRYVLGLLPGVACILFYNFYFTGSPFKFMYQFVDPMYGTQQVREHYGFIFPSFRALWGLTFSPYKGLFFYAPFLLLVLFYVAKNFSANKIAAYIKHPLVLPVIAYLLFISANQSWDGGWAYGPRHLIVLAVLLIFEGAIYLSRRTISKTALWVFLGIGIIITLATKVTATYSVPSDYGSCLNQLIFPELLKGHFNNNNMLYLLFKVQGVWPLVIWLGALIGGLFYLRYLNKKVSGQSAQ